MLVDKLYLVLNWEDPECTPDTVGIFTDLDMAMQAARVCTDEPHNRLWIYRVPCDGEVLRLERGEHIVIVEAVKPVCKPEHWLSQRRSHGPAEEV